MQWSLSKRPRKLSDIFGQDHVKKYFTNIHLKEVELLNKEKELAAADPTHKIKSIDEYPTVTALMGRYGTGKTTTAQILAMTMTCKNLDADGNPCCECPDCRAIIDQTFDRDVIQIDGGQAGKDDVIDTVADFIKTGPFWGNRKVVIIEEVQELSDKARNSMLRLTETTKSKIHFIFTSMDNLPATGFLSRAQIFKYRYAPVDDIMYYLKSIMESEGLWDNDAIPQEFKFQGLATIASNADGSYRQALQVLQQCIMTDSYTAEDIKKNFGYIDYESFANVMFGILNGSTDEVVFNTMIDGDFNNTFNLAYKVVSDAVQYSTFGRVSGGNESGTDYITKQAKQIAAHKNFPLMLQAFKEMSLSSRSGYLKKSDYVIYMCELLSKCKAALAVPVMQTRTMPTRQLPTRG